MSASDDLIERIANRALLQLRKVASDSSVLVVVDPQLADPLAEHADVVKAKALGLVEHVKLPAIHEDIDSQRTPYLLSVADPLAAERALTASVFLAVKESLGEMGDRYRGRSVCGWVISNLPAHEFAQRLRQAARVVRPDGMPWPLRLWDPRVVWHLPRVLLREQMVCLKPVLSDWWFLNPERQLQRAWPLADSELIQASGLPLRFGHSAWSLLERVGLVNTVLAQAWDWGVLPNEAQARRIDGLLVRCNQLGFTTEQDNLVFAAVALTSHERFDEHPQVRRALTEASQKSATLASALAEFDETFWANLAKDQALAQPKMSAPAGASI